MRRAVVCLIGVMWIVASGARAAGPTKVIVDTDFAAPPQDDGVALLLAVHSPELQILGVTTVAGNDSVEKATVDALRVLEIAGRSEIPVYRGARLPLLYEPDEDTRRVYGRRWSDDPPAAPPGGFARKRAEGETAVQFMVRTVMGSPGAVTILATGPLTNVAMAIRQEPAFARHVRQLVVMGGAIASLPDGAGNITPNAEFNFWVDPEAARIVLRSGMPIMLSPLNVARKTRFTKAAYDRIVAIETPVTRLLRDALGPIFAKDPARILLMYDQVAVASLIDPTLVKTKALYVDVETSRGANYGVSVGGAEIWSGAEGAQQMEVQYDLDWDRFLRLFVERVTRRTSP